MKFVVDIDDTLLKSEFIDGDYVLRGPIKDVIDKVNKAYDNGHEIILHTGRHWNCLKLTIKQLRLCNIKYDTLVMGKPIGDYYVDDKNLCIDKFLELDV